jgi:hypothetical protein
MNPRPMKMLKKPSKPTHTHTHTHTLSIPLLSLFFFTPFENNKILTSKSNSQGGFYALTSLRDANLLVYLTARTGTFLESFENTGGRASFYL